MVVFSAKAKMGGRGMEDGKKVPDVVEKCFLKERFPIFAPPCNLSITNHHSDFLYLSDTAIKIRAFLNKNTASTLFPPPVPTW